jgi:hypothetical protein
VKHNRQDFGSVHWCFAVDDIGLMVVVAQATDATHSVAEFRRYRPDITLMHSRLPDASGTDALIPIRNEFPEGPHHHADHIRLRWRDSTLQQRSKITTQSLGF